jgi:methionyl-tRNA formyltransferase
MSRNMRIIFAGTPAFAAVALRALLLARHQVALVLTQPDRPSGRGMPMTPSEVKRTAMEHGIAVDQPLSLRDDPVVTRLQRVEADVLIVAAYGLILPPPVLAVAPLGCINIHASLLPRWRGAAPVQRALLAGDAETGVSIMQMDPGLDTGPVLLERRVPIGADDTAATLEAKLAVTGGEAIVAALDGIERGELIPQPQPATGATYAHKITRDEARLDWSRTAIELERAIRAYNPAPGAYTTHAGQTLKIWRARADATATAAVEPGTVIANTGNLAVACGAGILSILELQRAGGRRQQAQEFVRGTPIPSGARLDT